LIFGEIKNYRAFSASATTQATEGLVQQRIAKSGADVVNISSFSLIIYGSV
jgi:hypothetical protein